MYISVTNSFAQKRINVTEELLSNIRKKNPKITSDVLNDNIHEYLSKYYYKIVPKLIAEFIIEYHDSQYTPNGYKIYDEMQIDNLIIVTIGYTRGGEAHTKMLAYYNKNK